MLNMKWTLSAALMATALTGIAPQAAAQSPNYRGTFTLPFEARFGRVILQPGNYTVSTMNDAKGILIHGENGNAAILAAGYELVPETRNGKMTMIETGGVFTLESLETGSMGKTLRFHVAKAKGNVERAAVKQTIEVAMQ